MDDRLNFQTAWEHIECETGRTKCTTKVEDVTRKKKYTAYKNNKYKEEDNVKMRNLNVRTVMDIVEFVCSSILGHEFISVWQHV